MSSKRTFAQVTECGAQREKCEHSWSADIIMTTLAGRAPGGQSRRGGWGKVVGEGLAFEVGERSLGFLIYTLARADAWKGQFYVQMVQVCVCVWGV